MNEALIFVRCLLRCVVYLQHDAALHAPGERWQGLPLLEQFGHSLFAGHRRSALQVLFEDLVLCEDTSSVLSMSGSCQLNYIGARVPTLVTEQAGASWQSHGELVALRNQRSSAGVLTGGPPLT